MRLLVLSDLHHEVWREARGSREPANRLLSELPSCLPDVVILAGDIDVGDRAVAWADRAFPGLPVVYIHGNHEGYGHSLDKVKEDILQACDATGHVHFLDKRQLVLGGVRFLGATLWTDFKLLGADLSPVAMAEAGEGMNDYRKIRLARDGYRKIRPADTLRWHLEDRNWLQAKLAEPFDGRTVVVTHMAPSGRSIPERYRGQPLSAAFASDLESLVAKVDIWVHGHIHDSMDYRIGDARVVCNPLGYPTRSQGGMLHPENSAYDPKFIVEI